MIKECSICGEEFEAVHSTRQYCNKCQKNSAKAREYQEKKLIASKYRLGEMPSQQMKKKHCVYCGREFHTYYAGLKFCSHDCRGKYNIEHAECIVCHALLFPLGIEKRNGRGYCSDKCKAQKRWKDALERRDVVNCKHCRKEFIRTGYTNEHCSKACLQASRSVEKSVTYVAQKVTDTCEICGALFERYANAKVYTCGKVCSEKRKKVLQETKRAEKRERRTAQKNVKQDTYAAKKRQENVNAVLSGKITGREALALHLCTGCKTSQKACSMFSSKFTRYPSGSETFMVDGHKIVLSCPDYT